MKRRTIDFLGTAVLSGFILWLLLHACLACYATEITGEDKPRDKANSRIPNHVHFVRLLEQPGDDLAFSFSDFLSIYAAEHYWTPRATYIHTNAIDETIRRARDGKAGRWTQLILQMSSVRVLRVSPPLSSQAPHFTRAESLMHQAEIVAVRAVRDMGGLYLDSNVHALNDIREYREGQADFVLAKTTDGCISSAMFMSTKGGKVVRDWADELQRSYGQAVVPAANDTLAMVLGGMQAEYYEMRILDAGALAETHGGRKSKSALTVQNGKQSKWTSDHGGGEEDGHVDDVPETTQWLKVAALPAGTAFDGLRPEDVFKSNSPLVKLLQPAAKAMQDAGLIRRTSL